MKTATSRVAAVLGTLGLVMALAPLGCGADDASTEDDELRREPGIDHAAMVEVSTVMLTADTLTLVLDENLDKFNQEDPFKIVGAPYKPVFQKHFAHFDGYDRKTDWTAEQSKLWLTRVTTGNYLVLDASKPCPFGSHTFLDVERDAFTGKPHQTCGGRMPNDDALDTVMTWLVRGPSTPVDSEDAVSDGVTQATKLSTDTFPYLAAPN
jgi:hypothetical protein